jgi:hypothetical protein
MAGRHPLLFPQTVLAALIAAAAISACSSSASRNAQPEGGSGYSNVEGGPLTCGPTGSLPQCGPTGGQTCCLDLNTASGTCVALGSCASAIQFECVDIAGCPQGKVCCTTPGEGGTSLTVTCETSCVGEQVQACQASAECRGGESCAAASPGSVVEYAGISTLCAPADAGIDDAAPTDDGAG